MARLLKTRLYHKQRDATRFVRRANDIAALFMEQGTGKTIVSLSTAARLWKRRPDKSKPLIVLVVTPKAVIEGWSRQCKQHLNVPFRFFGGRRSVQAAKSLIAGRYTGIIILSLNYEIVWRLIDILSGVEWCMIVADESQRIKKPTSKQSIGMWKLGLGVMSKLILSGTPIDKNEMDLWAQVRFLDENFFGNNFYKFRAVNCRRFGFKWKVRPQAKKRIRKKMRDIAIRILAKDMLDLPPTIDSEIRFELTGKAAKAYEEMESADYSEWGNLTTTSELAITTMIRLQQLTGGFLHSDQGIHVELEQDKLKAMLDFLKDIPTDRKIVIFARYRNEIDIIKEAMEYQKRTVGVLDGRTEDQGKAWTVFQDKPDPSVLILQIRSGGVGIELFVSSLCIFYSVNHSWIDYDQMRKRLDRNGQKSSVNFIHLVAENSIDVDLINSLKKKGQSSEEVLREMQHRRNSMARKATTKKADTTKKKSNLPPVEKPAYGVDQLAEALEVDASTARVKLRAGGAELKKKYKEGRAWDFKTAKNLAAVAKSLAAPKKKAAKKD